VQALYISVVDRSAILEKVISDRIGRPVVRSVLPMSICRGMEALCEYDRTMILPS